MLRSPVTGGPCRPIIALSRYNKCLWGWCSVPENIKHVRGQAAEEITALVARHLLAARIRSPHLKFVTVTTPECFVAAVCRTLRWAVCYDAVVNLERVRTFVFHCGGGSGGRGHNGGSIAVIAVVAVAAVVAALVCRGLCCSRVRVTTVAVVVVVLGVGNASPTSDWAQVFNLGKVGAVVCFAVRGLHIIINVAASVVMRERTSTCTELSNWSLKTRRHVHSRH